MKTLSQQAIDLTLKQSSETICLNIKIVTSVLNRGTYLTLRKKIRHITWIVFLFNKNITVLGLMCYINTFSLKSIKAPFSSREHNVCVYIL